MTLTRRVLFHCLLHRPLWSRLSHLVQYEDDTLIIVLAEAHQLFFLKCLLQPYASSTGLKMNFSKSFIVSINVQELKVETLAGTLGCQIGTMLFTCLGLPMGTTKPVMQDFLPLLGEWKKD
jgi:hypothetical protein